MGAEGGTEDLLRCGVVDGGLTVWRGGWGCGEQAPLGGQGWLGWVRAGRGAPAQAAEWPSPAVCCAACGFSRGLKIKCLEAGGAPTFLGLGWQGTCLAHRPCPRRPLTRASCCCRVPGRGVGGGGGGDGAGEGCEPEPGEGHGAVLRKQVLLGSLSPPEAQWFPVCTCAAHTCAHAPRPLGSSIPTWPPSQRRARASGRGGSKEPGICPLLCGSVRVRGHTTRRILRVAVPALQGIGHVPLLHPPGWRPEMSQAWPGVLGGRGPWPRSLFGGGSQSSRQALRLPSASPSAAPRGERARGAAGAPLPPGALWLCLRQDPLSSFPLGPGLGRTRWSGFRLRIH